MTTLATVPPLALSAVQALFPTVDRLSRCHLNSGFMPGNTSDILTPQVRAQINQSTGITITAGIRLSDMLGLRNETVPNLAPFTIAQAVVADVTGSTFVTVRLPGAVQAGSTLVCFTVRRLPPSTIILEDLSGQSWTSARFNNIISTRTHSYFRANMPAFGVYDLSIYDAAFTDTFEGTIILLELRGVAAAPYSLNTVGTSFALPLTLTLASAPVQLPALNFAFMGVNYDDPLPFDITAPIPPSNAGMVASRNGLNAGSQSLNRPAAQLVAWVSTTAVPASVTMNFSHLGAAPVSSFFGGMLLSFLPGP